MDIEELRSAKAENTQLVSIYVPEGYEMSKIRQMVNSELSTCNNIKSDRTRKGVESALKKLKQYLAGLKTPENGIALFASSEGVNSIVPA
jgi:peptide chain release factor subunit 1